MANLYPPILSSQRTSIASEEMGEGTVFKIPFSMPSSTEIGEIGHVQVLIQRLSNLDSWSSWDHAYVPEKTTIYLPVSVNETTLVDSYGSLEYAGTWYACVPESCIRGLSSTSNNDSGDSGFPAGVSGEGEIFTIQLRFGEDFPDFIYNTSLFSTWNSNCVANRTYGEWSNTQKMFVYSLGTASSLADLFTIDYFDNPVLGLSWVYKPESDDSLIDVSVSYAYTNPAYAASSYDWSNFSGTVSLPITGSSGTDSGGYGEASFSIMRFTDIVISITFTTINNTVYKWTPSAGVIPGYDFETKMMDGLTSMNASITEMPILGEETEDGIISMAAQWSWLTKQEGNSMSRCELYRVCTESLLCILLETVYIDEASGGQTANLSFKDYSIEMGESYIYFILAYDGDTSCLGGILWDYCLQSGSQWDPYSYVGYARNLDFQGNSFLTSKYQQLKLQGNVSVSSFQRNTNDQITTTLGSQYPFFSRPSSQNYRTFSLQGLIGLDFDVTNTFFSFRSKTADDITTNLTSAALSKYLTTVAELDDSQTALKEQAILDYYFSLSSIYKGVNPDLSYLDGTTTITPARYFLKGEKSSWMNGELWFDNGTSIDTLILRNSDLFESDTISYNVKRVLNATTGHAYIANAEETGMGHQYSSFGRTLYSEDVTYDSSGNVEETMYRRSYNTNDIRSSENEGKKIYAERKFRDAVMSWFSDGKPKLFRSETEGNMIVMITTPSFTPFLNNRKLYSFSATVTEIAEYNLENLIKYDLVPSSFESFYLPIAGDGFSPADEDEAAVAEYDEQFEVYSKVEEEEE